MPKIIQILLSILVTTVIMMRPALASVDLPVVTKIIEPNEYQNIDLDIHLPKEQVNPKPESVQMYLGEGVEADMNRALLMRDWQALKFYLDAYTKEPNYDVLAYQYALGAWHRSQGNYRQAIDLYEQILKKQPDADYLRFDLGMMAFENKQYKDAKKYLKTAKAGLEPKLQAIAGYYLAQIDKAQRIHPDFTLNYEQTNNVNQASNVKKIEWQGKTWIRNDDDLPKSAKGVRYGLSATYEHNLAGNHYWVSEFDGRGIYYWDIDGYDEQNLSVHTGYRRQDIRQNFSVLPFFEQTWVDGQRYSNEKGLALRYGYILSPKWRANASLLYAKKRYNNNDLAKRYDGHHWAGNTMFNYRLNQRMLVFSGLDLNQENNQDHEKSSSRWGLSVGTVAEHSSGLGGRLSLRFAKRQFKVPDLFFQIKRQDNEYHVQSTFWHNKFNYKGFMPQLNIRYHRIDSNIAGLYSKDGMQAFISVDKQF